MSMPSADLEPLIHGISGTPFGDLEYDAGKSVRWMEYFVHTTFIQDVNTGEQRYWVINWAESFPLAKSVISGINFFRSPAEWRKAQFDNALKAWAYGDDDWVLFIDGHEGLSVDNRTLPDDYNISMFKSFIWREIQRAVDADPDADTIHVPFFVYLKHSDLQNITYAHSMDAGASELGLASVNQAVSVPWYLPSQSLPRLFKVSALKDPGFNWASLDTRVALPDPAVKIQLISYGYAHWNVQDIPPGHTTVPPLDANNDDGWRMRTRLSLVRPIPGLPVGTTWQPLSADPASFPGPWCVDTTSNVDPSLAVTVEEAGHTPPATACQGVRVPLYDTVMRLNLRDGLWYERGSSGNIPLSWDDANQVWVPNYDPDEWPNKGITAQGEARPAPSTLSLRLNGSAGTFSRTLDSNALDFASAQAFTLMAYVALDTWHPASRQTLVSKWGAAGQRSWFWANEVGGGMVLVISRDGTASIQFSLNLTDGAAFNLSAGEHALIAASYHTKLADPAIPGDQAKDSVQFWMIPELDESAPWQPVGPALIQPNPTSAVLFNSTAEVQIGAQQGTLTAAGYYRFVGIMSGIGEQAGGPYPGGNEVARMRGDLPSNPTYDRYGNLWSNQGSGWSYAEMP